MANRSPKIPALHRKSESARRANQIIRGRTLLMMLVLGVATFCCCSGGSMTFRSTSMTR